MIVPGHLLVDRCPCRRSGRRAAARTRARRRRGTPTGRRASGLKLFWWIVPTSFSSSLCAARMISAAGHLVEVAHLQPDDAVLDVVDDPDAVARADLPRALQQLDQAEPLAVQRHRAAALELDLHVLAPRPARPAGRVTSSNTSSRGGSSGPRSGRPPTSGPRGCRRSSTAAPRCRPSPGCRARARSAISSSRPICQPRTGAMIFSSRVERQRPCPRSAPGRCPCRCSRGRPCRSRTRAPSRPRSWRSAAGRAP